MIRQEELTLPAFVHRNNSDRTFDSICTGCFATIGTSIVEAELLSLEQAHRCTAILVAQQDDSRATRGIAPPKSRAANDASAPEAK